MATDRRLRQTELASRSRKRSVAEYGEKGAVEISAWFGVHIIMYSYATYFVNFVYLRMDA
jgi:hypothetical protein